MMGLKQLKQEKYQQKPATNTTGEGDSRKHTECIQLGVQRLVDARSQLLELDGSMPDCIDRRR